MIPLLTVIVTDLIRSQNAIALRNVLYVLKLIIFQVAHVIVLIIRKNVYVLKKIIRTLLIVILLLDVQNLSKENSLTALLGLYA